MSDQPSNNLTRADVHKVARLSRLKITDEEADRLARQMGEVLQYVAMLEEVDTTGVEPMVHAMELTNVLRPDDPFPALSREAALSNAPRTDQRYFLVPPIIEN